MVIIHVLAYQPRESGCLMGRPVNGHGVTRGGSIKLAEFALRIKARNEAISRALNRVNDAKKRQLLLQDADLGGRGWTQLLNHHYSLS